MSKLKLAILLVTLFAGTLLKAQTIDEGKKFMYYEKYKSARLVFEKLVAANPNDIDAVYWLGQALIGTGEKKDIEAAKALYQKTLMANSSSPLLLAGMGHIELLEEKTQDARNRFETALSLSQSKNAAVLNAIGFANVNAPKGDASYAVEKLKLATTLKNMKDPDVYVNLGDAHKKLTEGGPAQTAYETALALNPNYARATYRIGKIYQTQGVAQNEIYMRYYNDAIAKDATYGPVYENLYEYYYATDVGKSGEYLEKFLVNTDDDPKNCYYRASMQYAQGHFNEAIKKSQECITAGGTEPYPSLYGLIAYSNKKLYDSLIGKSDSASAQLALQTAKSSFETYFQKQKEDKIGPVDYKTYGEVLLKFPGSEALAATYIDKALLADTTESGRVALLKPIATGFEAQKNYKEAANWYNRIIAIKANPTKTDMYYAGYDYFRGGEYDSAIKVFNVYAEKFPDDAFGYYMLGKSKWAIDSTLDQGLANADFQKSVDAGSKDSVKYKPQLIGSYKYFIVYSVYKKDKPAALSYADKVLALDPNDAETVSNKTTISGMNFNAAAPKTKQAAGTKPAGKSGGTKAAESPQK